MAAASSNFDIKKYNASALHIDTQQQDTFFKTLRKKPTKYDSDHYLKMGSIIKGLDGSYSCDVLFTAPQPGFVVQKIEKRMDYYSDFNRHVTKYLEYWEIFYITPAGTSHNSDGFVQKGLGPNSHGIIVQTGYAKFYPYSVHNVAFHDDVMIPNAELKDIFGPHVKFAAEPAAIPAAAGLPSSNREPIMKGLVAEDTEIIHQVTAVWGKKDKYGDNSTEVLERVVIKEPGSATEKDLDRPSDDYFERKKVTELKEIMKSTGLPTVGKKQELVEDLNEIVTGNFNLR